MKRCLLFPMLALSLSMLSAAQFHESNALMQEKGVLTSLTGSGYELKTDGNEKVLYLDGEEVRRVSEMDGIRTVTEKGRSVSYSGSLQPVRIVTETDEGTDEELYEYSPDGVLKRVIHVSGGSVTAIIEYDYSPSSGLASFRRDDFSDPMYISRDSYTFSSDGEDVKVTVLSDLILRESGTDGYSAEGDIITVREGSDELVYSAVTGLLMERRFADGTVTEYSYSDRELVREEKRSGSEVTITEYLPEGMRLTVKDGDEVKRVREKNKDGITETVYRSSSPYALVTYDSDGLRVLEVKVL